MCGFENHVFALKSVSSPIEEAVLRSCLLKFLFVLDLYHHVESF